MSVSADDPVQQSRCFVVRISQVDEVPVTFVVVVVGSELEGDEQSESEVKHDIAITG
jgi:hypothetical protein